MGQSQGQRWRGAVTDIDTWKEIQVLEVGREKEREKKREREKEAAGGEAEGGEEGK